MMEYVLVGMGGILGSLTRYELGRRIAKAAKPGFPVGTLIINVTGALLLGLLVGLKIQGDVYRLFGDGFLGAYTTFSTFMVEGVDLFKGRKLLNGFVYVLGTLILGLLAFEAVLRILNYPCIK